MNLLAKLAGASVALALTMGASAAAASIVTATYTGTISGTNGVDTGGAFDNTGEFGNLTSLDGLGFTAVFTFDSNVGYSAFPGGEQVTGGSNYGGPSGFTSATLSIAGLGTRSFASDYAAVALVVTDGIDSATQHLAASAGTIGALTYVNFLEGVLYNSTLPLNLTGPFSGGHLASSGLASLGEFQIVEQDTGTLAYAHNAHGYLAVDNLTISSTEGVPEPASWALILVGFAGLGAALRTGRRRALAA